MINDFETAKKVSELMLSTGASLDKSVADVVAKCPKDEAEMYKIMIGDLMGGLLDVMIKIYNIHPALKPDELHLPIDLNRN